MRPDLHINQENTQTSVDLLLKKGFETLDDKEEDFTQKYFIKKWYFSIKEYFCEFSLGRRLHTRKTKK